MTRKIRQSSYPGTTDPRPQAYEESHRKLARRAAAEGMVLLKNEGQVLPIPAGSRIALFGAGASETVKGGTGSGDVNERESVSIYQGLKNAGYEITTESWIRAYEEEYCRARCAWRDEIQRRAEGSKRRFTRIYFELPFQIPVGPKAEDTDADTAIYVLSRVAGEGKDRSREAGDYLLGAEEKALLADICGYYEKVIVAVNTGGLVDLSFLDEFPNIRGLLQIVQPGMEGGNAFADVVSGKVIPSGKLTDSWACRYEDYPNSATFSHNNGNVEEEYYEEGIYVGYRYFDSFQVPVRYGFGYGLSYTQFQVETLGVSCGQDVTVTVRVTNVGTVYSGREVAQVYVSAPEGRLEKEYRRLCAFAKTRVLAPGESQELTLSFPVYRMASYDEAEAAWILEAGFYGVWVGNSLEDSELAALLELGQEKKLVQVTNICPCQKELRELTLDPAVHAARYAAWTEKARSEGLPVEVLDLSDVETEVVGYDRPTHYDVPAEVEAEAAALAERLSLEQCVLLAAGDPGKGQGSTIGAAGISVPGSAGETSSCAAVDGVANIVLADGPAGLRLNQYYFVNDGEMIPLPFAACFEHGFLCGDVECEGEKYYQYCTAIPVGTLLAQSWDEELLREVGAMIAEEMRRFQVTLWLAPGMNIHRNPLCGRNFEYYSEDPLLAGKMAAAMTQGVQSLPGCGTTIKHFACNNQEDNRRGSDSILSERALREIYLKGFEIAVKESHPLSIMTSYNLINGVHAANCQDTCTKAARREWGFDGVIMTDWNTTIDDASCTASGCIRAGNDLIMPGQDCDLENIRQELAAGTLSERELRDCIVRLIGVILRSGRYE